MNLEVSSFSGNAAGRIRAILQEGFYLLPISGESDADHAARVQAKTAELAAAAGIEGLTNGKVSIYGLAYGNYYLVETKAPTGYNLLGKPFELTVDESSHREEKTITIKNSTDSVLPGTGSMGTTLFTVIGFSLMCIASVLLFVKRRMARL